MTSLGEHALRKKLSLLDFFRYEEKLCFDKGVLASIDDPIFTKKVI